MRKKSILTLNQALEILHTETPYVTKKYRMNLIGVFGSWVRGEEKKNSDIDILVDPQKGASLWDMVGLSDYLQTRLGRKVDVVSEQALRDRVKPTVYHDLVKL